jgi:cyclic pyranopterin phosphate synthase
MQALSPLGLEPLSDTSHYGPAREYSLMGGKGNVGFISPLSDHFCHRCNRLRLTADGNLRPCLLQDIEVPILPAMRAGEAVLPYLQKAIDVKPTGHELAQNHLPSRRCMMQIGG